MRKFKFRLTTLLKLREQARDERRSQLAQAYQAEAILREEGQRLERDLQELGKQNRDACGPGTLDLERLMDSRRYELVLRAQRQDLNKKMEMLEAEIGRRREALVEANREVRVLELLRERQLARHRQEESRQEINLLDEVAGRRARREARQ
jgi:flagellar export protein FliJ